MSYNEMRGQRFKPLKHFGPEVALELIKKVYVPSQQTGTRSVRHRLFRKADIQARDAIGLELRAVFKSVVSLTEVVCNARIQRIQNVFPGS
jgi:hypothetical protein